MTFRRSAPAASITVFVAVLILNAVATNRLFASLIHEIEGDRFALMRSVLLKGLNDAQDAALGRAEMFARLTSVQAALAAGDRDALVAELKPSFDAQKERFGVRKAEVAVPPATIFVRLHKPAEGIGEDVSSFRPIIVEANAARQALKGVSISRSGPSIAGVAPITDAAGQHLGTLEVGLDYGPLLDGIKTSYDLDAAVFFDEAPLREVATSLSGDVLSDENRVGGYIRFYSTNTERFRALITARELSSTAEQHYVRDASGVPYGVALLPVKDYTGEPIGMVAVAADFSSTRASESRMIVWQALLVLIGSVLGAATVLTVVRGMVLRPLGVLAQKLAALAAGDRGQPIDAQADGLCEEMAQMAASYEALRTRSGDEP